MLSCSMVLDLHRETILQRRNVVGSAVGLKYVNGQPTSQPAILVFVQNKISKRNVISSFSAAELVPPSIDGIPTDVIEVGDIVKQQYRTRSRPIRPGYSCGHPAVTVGTIGGLFTDRDGDNVILSNCHILANENRAAIGDPIFQPGLADHFTNTKFVGWPDPIEKLPYFATLKKFVKLGATNNLQDSAIAKIHEKFVSQGLIDVLYPDINRALTGVGSPVVGMDVQKFGRTTGHTAGKIIGLGASFTIAYDFGMARFDDCLVLSGMSNGGDSGSLILDTHMRAVGLLFAGSDKVTIANDIKYPVAEYGLQLWGQPPKEVIGISDPGWSQIVGSGSISQVPNGFSISAAANNYCFLEKSVGRFNSARVTVNTGSDLSATWGPGLVVQWPSGIVKVNLRGDRYGGYYNTNANIGLGAVLPNTNYVLRIRRTTTTILGEIQGPLGWTTVVEVPNNLLPGNPKCVRIGKTGELGNSANHSDPGASGTSTYTDIIVNSIKG